MGYLEDGCRELCEFICVGPINWDMPFKVIQGRRGRCQSKASMRLPISDSY